ncbi:DUF4249 domain-containing protein [Lacihabitans sp. LS3-19]|uniref:DUF4249 domain-containing protein n=1 Tax=Lacihabitans sp. LS3-19 TaxID=2487335 RepID=UPI0020CD99C4|nr:DUF4249 domain-containing protein [Lacihabitans sp. LS3-19]MCP9767352.1 DUF4249 domain-containing protein [Lacihabitans sp. LS3-19]
MNIHSKIFLVATFIFLIACVEPFSIAVDVPLEVISVEAEITDEDIQQKLNISNSYYLHESLYKEPISGLQVEIIINGSQKIDLKEEEYGNYSFPVDFRAKIGDSYQLLFQKKDGDRYQSNVEKLSKSPEIDAVFDEFKVNGTIAFGRTVPSKNVYINFKDVDLSSNFYQWSWKLWEQQFVCLSTDYYDLYCREECYEMLYNEEINIQSDEFYNGKSVEGKLIGKIPYYQYEGALLEIKQETISSEAYSFYKQIKDLSQNTGSLADTPPQIVEGNIKNIDNPSEIVVGMLMAKGVSTKYYWLDRENAKGKASPIGLLGRKSISSGGSVTAPCIPSKNKTKDKPKNWLG